MAIVLLIEGAVIAGLAPAVMSDMDSNTVTTRGSSSMSTRSNETTIHVIEHAPPSHMKMFGVVETFANPIFDSRDLKQIGRDQGFCLHIPLTKTPECMWTTILPGGEITVEGPLSDAQVTVIAVTGGTGRYEDARGSVESKAHNKAGTKFYLVFHVRI